MGTPNTASGSSSGLDFDGVLEHYGIKGMRWGVRRKNPSGTSALAPASEDVERARRTYATVRAHGTKAVSNKDLQDLINRMNLEAQYSSIVSKSRPPTVLDKINKGNKSLKIILDSAKTAVEVDSLLKRTTGTGLVEMVKKPKIR